MSAGRLARLVPAACALVAAAPAASDGDPAGYRVRLTVQPAGSAMVQRIALPAEILAAAQAPDLADVRVFDARGRAMPIARAPAAATPFRRDTMMPLPILGSADSLKITGVSLRIDDRGQARVAEVDGSVHGPSGSVLLGVLIDARAISGAARRLTLDAALPAAQPITFTVAASRDLKDWRTIAERVVYRVATGGNPPAILPLGGAAIDRDYLRVTWRGATRLLSPVTIRATTLVTQPSGAADMPGAPATLPKGEGGAAIELALPFVTPLAAIRIVPTGDDVLVPVRVLGRNDREHPWTPLGNGNAVAARTGRPASTIPLGGTAFRQLRIEAGRPATGFTASPDIRLEFAPAAILFVAAGRPPFTLAAGQAGVADSYLPAAAMLDQAAGTPPDAAVAASPAFVVPLAHGGDDSADRRQPMLWAILVAATVLLGAMAWRLWTTGKDAPRNPEAR